MRYFLSLISGMLILIVIGCEKDKQLSTSIQGRVLEEGTLKLLISDSLYIRIIEGVPCGMGCFWGENTRHIATVPVVKGKYEYSFMANDKYHWMEVKRVGTNYSSGLPYFEITPGKNQTRDFILPKQSEIKFTFHDKGLFPEKNAISITTDSYSGPNGRLELDSTTLPPYNITLGVNAGQTYSFEVTIFYASSWRTEKYYYEIPYHDTLEINLNI